MHIKFVKHQTFHEWNIPAIFNVSSLNVIKTNNSNIAASNYQTIEQDFEQNAHYSAFYIISCTCSLSVIECTVD